MDLKSGNKSGNHHRDGRQQMRSELMGSMPRPG
jgi:hypothetical protein